MALLRVDFWVSIKKGKIPAVGLDGESNSIFFFSQKSPDIDSREWSVLGVVAALPFHCQCSSLLLLIMQTTSIIHHFGE